MWESWRRPPKQKKQKTNLLDFSKFCMPVIKRVMPDLTLKDIFGVQPLNLPGDKKTP